MDWSKSVEKRRVSLEVFEEAGVEETRRWWDLEPGAGIAVGEEGVLARALASR